ncbi:MAG: YggT family protein [Hyphomicrobiaceae bacterium]
MIALLEFIRYLLGLYSWVVIASVVLSWLVAFNVINPYNNFVRSLMHAFDAVTRPLLTPIRRFLPKTAGIDFSPIVLLLAVFFVQSVVIGTCGSGFLMPMACQG